MALQKKPPVITIMGHVDHGKTSLLDFIRQTKLVAKEFGEITQHIGAYQITFHGQKITFIDTPGHAAFAKMRTRGVSAADLVVLVVAANDGVMPQTQESIKIINEAQIPFLVAINKIDLPEASADRVKTQLAENEVLVEGYGGKVVSVPVSAKTGEGIDQLLKMILLSAEMNDLKADPQAPLVAMVIESGADKFCGPVATVIVKNGSLKLGDTIYAGRASAKVKMLKNELGKPVMVAEPGDPVQVLGFNQVPVVGSLVAGAAAGDRKEVEDVGNQAPANVNESKLKIILKADTSGSLEAIAGCLSDDVMVVDSGVGEINESDVISARHFGAEIYAFNLAVSGSIEKLADMEKVKVKTYRIIYDLLKDLEARVLKIMEPNIDRKIRGRAEILAVFEMKGEKIAGAKVIEGKINKGFPVFIQRGEKILAETKIISLKQGKQDINEAVAGTEFGAILGAKVDFQPGDVLSSYSHE